MSDDDIEHSSASCPKCGKDTVTKPCDYCDEDGMSDHDCGDDTCCCLHPEPNVRCNTCNGKGFFHWCRHCGWDLHQQRYLK